MKRKTITLSDELAKLVEREAQRREVSFSEMIRQLITEKLVATAEHSRTIPWAGIVNDPGLVCGERIDETLGQEWSKDIALDRE